MHFFLNYFNTIRAEIFFLVSAMIFGVSFLFLTPPFQVPDEPNHFYRTWQVAEGGFISVKQDKRVGGYLPASLEKVTQPFSRMIWSKDVKIKDMDMPVLLNTSPEPENKKFYDFNNTALYSPLCYLPGAAAIFILNRFNAPPLYAFYGARLMSLLFWIWIIFYAIKLLVVYKWLFTFFALLPMSLFVNMSLSADVVTNAICFLFIALTITYAVDPHELDKTRIRNLFLSVFLLVAVKSVYAPLILLLLIIPKTKFRSTKDRLLKMSCLFAFALLFAALWNALLNPLYLSYENYNPEFRDSAALVNGADMPKQIEYILHHGAYLMNVIVYSLKVSFDMYFPGYIGTFGWLDLPLPFFLVVSTYLLLLLIALLEGDKSIFINWKQKGVFFISFLIILFLVFLSQHLIWDLVGGEAILNIQGRYLIPFVPLLFLVVYTRKIAAQKTVRMITIVSVITLLVVSFQILYSRYH